MKTVKITLVIELFALIGTLLGLQSASAAHGTPTITYWHKEWRPGPAADTFFGECVTTADADASSPALTTAPSYGITFHTEPYNDGLLAADTYLLDSAGRKVKQIGHADVEPQNYLSDSSSPFSFSMTDAGDGTFSLEEDALFAGTSLEGLSLRCRGLSESQ
jgi:hypothetical protein